MKPLIHERRAVWRMFTNCVIQGDSLEGMRALPAESVDLVFTSPPYADLREPVKIPPDQYTKWFLPFALEVHRILKPTGSFVLNINDRIQGWQRHTYVLELVVEINRLGLGLVDRLIWSKTNPVPTGARRRPIDSMEYLWWFAKGPEYVFNVDEVRRPYEPSSLARYEASAYQPKRQGYVTRTKMIAPNPKGAMPFTVITGPVAAKHYGHEAVMPDFLAEWFVKAMSPMGGIVVDPFAGSGTTGVSAIRHNRYFVGWDLQPQYVAVANDRIAAEMQRSQHRSGTLA